MNRALLLTTVALGLALPAPAAAWNCISGECPVWCDATDWYFQTPSVALGESTSLAQLQAGMADWTTLACTSLRASYSGRSGATPGVGDRTNVIGWVQSGWRHSGTAIGVTGVRTNPSTGCISESDMELNEEDFTWTTGSGRGSLVNAYSIITHEGGHFYGMGHSSDRGAIMYASYSGGIGSINADDQTGICTLYPGTGGDCSTTGCPEGWTCEADGNCAERTGLDVCAPCETAAQCGGSADLCINYGDGDFFCGRTCTSAAQCDAGQDCREVSGGGRQCVGIVGGTPSCDDAGCTNDDQCTGDLICDVDSGECVEPGELQPLGAPCGGHGECASSLCVPGADGSFVCSQICGESAGSACPSGFYCDIDAFGLCGEGLCRAGAAGAGAIGAACSGDGDCSTLMCLAGRCEQPCSGPSDTSCPAGYACESGDLLGCYVCAGDAPAPTDAGSPVATDAGPPPAGTDAGLPAMDAGGSGSGPTGETGGSTRLIGTCGAGGGGEPAGLAGLLLLGVLVRRRRGPGVEGRSRAATRPS